MHLLTNPTVAAAIVLVVIWSLVVGAAVYLLVFRPLRAASALSKVVASLGLFLYFQQVVQLNFPDAGANSSSVPTTLLPDGTWELLGMRLSANRTSLALVAIGITVILTVVFRHTRFGLATRAAAENEKGSLLCGLRPDRLATVNGMIAALLAGGAVILIEQITPGTSADTTPLLVVPALAAALLGGLSAFGITTAAALAIGMLQSAIGNFATLHWDWVPAWIPKGGLATTVPLVAIVIALVVRGDLLPGRGAVLEPRLPRAPRPRLVGVTTVVLSGLVLLRIFSADSVGRQAVIVSLIAALMALSIVVLTGYVGQISLAQGAFAGTAAFVMVKLQGEFGVPFPIAPLLAAGVAVVLGIVIGIPALRVRGMTLAVATLAMATAIEALVLRSDALGGETGSAVVPQPRVFGINLSIAAQGADNFRVAFAVLALVVLVIIGLIVANLRRNRTGLRWLAVRANERAAAAAGIDVSRTKLGAFAFSSFVAGLAGTLLAYEFPTTSVVTFTAITSLVAVALTYLGGISSIGGALVAGLIAQSGVIMQLGGSSSGRYQIAISGIILILVTIFAPSGIAASVGTALHRPARSPTPEPIRTEGVS